ncbi:hypothetical protein [Vibrio sp. H11]|uniref:hypothetical protein n=1 Tax=Vibrio sp. H11 TaxID=2565928 RepID=UPI0010A5C0FE|nr:hypothetical protein [Vibrio sp. H11]
MEQVSLTQQLYLSLMQLDDLLAIMDINSPQYQQLCQQQAVLRSQYSELVVSAVNDTSRIEELLQTMECLCDESHRLCGQLHHRNIQCPNINTIIQYADQVSESLDSITV